MDRLLSKFSIQSDSKIFIKHNNKIMKTLLTFLLFISLTTLFCACQTTSDFKKFLSKKENRKELLDNIANDSEMMKEMNEAALNSKTGKTTLVEDEKINKLIMENNSTMLKIMKNNPELMNRMLSDMMETAKSDSSMMYGMYNTMMKNKGMLDMIQKHKGNNMGGENMNMNNMNGENIDMNNTEKENMNMNNMDG